MVTAPLSLTTDELREGLTACLAVPRWVDDVAAAGPYSALDPLLESARGAASPLSAVEIDQALGDHPRIGEQAVGHGRSQSFSAAEQASSASDDDDLTTALSTGNSAYETKFGRVFLIRAAGRTRKEILEELNRRLELAHDAELEVVGSELRDIALLRLTQLFSHLDTHSEYDESEAAR